MSSEEAIKHVNTEVKKLFYYTNQQNLYVQTKIQKNGYIDFGTIEAKDSMDLKGKQKIYLYCTCCGTKKEDVQKAIDKKASFFGSICFCDECHRLWLDLCNYCTGNRINLAKYDFYDKYMKF